MPLPAFDVAATTLPHVALAFQDEPVAAPQTGDGEAQTTALDPAAPTGQGTQPAPSWLVTLWNLGPIILIIVLFYFLILGGNRKKEKQRQEMISKLSRGDRVTTIGGIVGSVVDASGEEIVLKIDENNNTKLRIIRSAVASVSRGDGGGK